MGTDHSIPLWNGYFQIVAHNTCNSIKDVIYIDITTKTIKVNKPICARQICVSLPIYDEWNSVLIIVSTEVVSNICFNGEFWRNQNLMRAKGEWVGVYGSNWPLGEPIVFVEIFPGGWVLNDTCWCPNILDLLLHFPDLWSYDLRFDQNFLNL